MNKDDIKNELLNYLTEQIQKLEHSKIMTDEEVEAYDYVGNVIRTLNKSKEFFVNVIEESQEEKERYISLISRVISKEELDSFLSASKNLYYLKKVNDLESSILVPQEQDANRQINRFIDSLNRFICKTDRNLYQTQINKITEYAEKLMDLADSIEYETEIKDIDLFEHIIENSDFSDEDKEKIVEYAIEQNLNYYNSKNNDELKEMTEEELKMSEIENLIISDEHLKKIISLIEDKKEENINLDDYKVEEKYTEDIKVYLSFVREKVKEYLDKNSELTPDAALNKFYIEYQKIKEEKDDNKKLFYTETNNKSYLERDLNSLSFEERQTVSTLLNNIKENEGKQQKEDTNFLKLTVFDVHTVSLNNVNLSYIKVDENNYIILGATNKKIKNHNEILEKRLNIVEDQVVDIMTKVIRNEDLSYYRKSSKKHEERIKSKINSKDPVLEILDEDDDYEKPIIIGVAKK